LIMARTSLKEEPTVRSVYNPSKEHKKELDFVYTRKQDMYDARQDFEIKWDSLERQYNAYVGKSDLEDWQSDYFVPITTSVIESILSEMVDQAPKPMILPRNPEDAAKATILKHIFEYTWEMGNGDVELYKVLKDALIFGTGIAQEYYLSSPRTVQEMVKYNPVTGEEEFEEREIRDYDDVYMEAVKLQDFFVDPSARYLGTGPKAARDCVRRYIMHIDDFRNQFKGPVWNAFDSAKYVKTGGQDTNYYEFYEPPLDLREDQVEVLWYWNKPLDKLIIVANDVLVRSTPNPYSHKQLPFARLVDLMNPHQFYGKGDAELLSTIQKELNKLRRMRHDRMHLSIDQMFLVSSREMIDEAQLIARPHGAIEVDDISSIKPLEYKDTPSSSYKEEEQMKDDIVRVTGVDERSQSVAGAGTATEATILKEATLKRIRLKLRMMERDFLTMIARLRVSNVQQFYTTPMVERIAGKDAKEIQAKIKLAKSNGTFEDVDGVPHTKKFRNIRIMGRELSMNQSGEIVEETKPGIFFFRAVPELVKGQYDIRIAAGSTLPISKALQQSKAKEMVEVVLPLAIDPQSQLGYDPVKIIDYWIRMNDEDPEEFKTKDALAGEEQAMGETQQQIEMAHEENEQIMKGTEVPPTPMATPGHTDIHAAYIKSDKFKAVTMEDPKYKVMMRHVMGEAMAQQKRAGGGQPEGGGQPAPMGPPGAVPGPSKNAAQAGGSDALPGLIQGGGQVESTPFARGKGPGG